MELQLRLPLAEIMLNKLLDLSRFYRVKVPPLKGLCVFHPLLKNLYIERAYLYIFSRPVAIL